MKKRLRTPSFGVSSMMAQLMLASWETIYRRTVLMTRGKCSEAEYRRMVTEKMAAMQSSTKALLRGRGDAAALAPFVTRARANAKRLRRGK